MSMTPLQAIGATKFLQGTGISPHVMSALVAQYRTAVFPIKSQVDQYVQSIIDAATDEFGQVPEGLQESLISQVAFAWPAGSGYIPVGNTAGWASNLQPPVDLFPLSPTSLSEELYQEIPSSIPSVGEDGAAAAGAVSGSFSKTGSNFDVTKENIDILKKDIDVLFNGPEPPIFNTLDAATLGYCNYVMCSGDPGRFSIVLDKAIAFTNTTGDLLGVMDKAKTMNFDDFGPNVANYSDVVNMGMGKLSTEFSGLIKSAGSKLPLPASAPKSDSFAVGATLAAQGDLAGPPDSENAGTALGLWEQLLKNKDIISIYRIAQSMVRNSTMVFVATLNIPEEVFPVGLIQFQLRFPMTESSVEADLLNEVDARAEQLKETDPLTSALLREKVISLRRRSLSSLVEEFNDTVAKLILEAAYFASEVYPNPLPPGNLAENKFDLYNNYVLTEAVMEPAINGLSEVHAAALFSKYRSTLRANNLPSPMSALDLGKVAGAVPAPMNALSVPVAISSWLPAKLSVPKVQVPGVGGLAGSLINSAVNNQISSALDPVTSAANRGLATVNQAVSNATGAINRVAGIVSSLKSSAKSIMGKLDQVKGFKAVDGLKSVGTMLKSMETTLPTPNSFLGAATGPAVPAALNSIKQVMPTDVISQLKSVVGTGSGGGGQYSVTDFLGSAVGLNNQIAMWQEMNSNLSRVSFSAPPPSDTASIALLVAALTAAANSEAGKKVTAEYNKIIAQFRKEWYLLTGRDRAKIDFVNLPAKDVVTTINFSKKLAQYAHQLDNGVAEILNLAADPSDVGGQAMLTIMMESRNMRLMQKAGFSPANIIESKGTAVEPTEEDKVEAAKIQSESGDPESVTPEQVARNRALNKTLTSFLSTRK
jgi:hypothetical protein